jgi:hypothetical protein
MSWLAWQHDQMKQMVLYTKTTFSVDLISSFFLLNSPLLCCPAGDSALVGRFAAQMLEGRNIVQSDVVALISGAAAAGTAASGAQVKLGSASGQLRQDTLL